MNTKKDTGIFQLDNGYWGYCYNVKIEGVLKDSCRTIDEPCKYHQLLFSGILKKVIPPTYISKFMPTISTQKL